MNNEYFLIKAKNFNAKNIQKKNTTDRLEYLIVDYCNNGEMIIVTMEK